jgi:uncharacterized protein (UPF0261 family)
MGKIVILGTLDTKGQEIEYVKRTIERKGHEALVIDCGVVGKPHLMPDITREEVAKAAGSRIDELINLNNERKAMDLMAEGASNIARDLYLKEDMDGILSIGGTMGTNMGVTVMNAVPTGMPKVMLSTVALSSIFLLGMISSGFMRKDITMMQSTVDFWGLNSVVRGELDKAAGAVTGMVDMKREVPSQPLIGVTTLGDIASGCTKYLPPMIEEKGYGLIVFHTAGMGGKFLEQFIEEDRLTGVLDLSLCDLMVGVIESLYGRGIMKADETRLEAGAKKGIPQVVSPGNMSFVFWAGPRNMMPPQFKDREAKVHSGFSFPFKASEKEMIEAARLLAEKLSKWNGPTTVLLPVRGFDGRDRPGGPFHNPVGIKAFIETFKKHMKPEIKVVEVDHHISDEAFAETAVETLFKMIKS